MVNWGESVVALATARRALPSRPPASGFRPQISAPSSRLWVQLPNSARSEHGVAPEGGRREPEAESGSRSRDTISQCVRRSPSHLCCPL